MLSYDGQCPRLIRSATDAVDILSTHLDTDTNDNAPLSASQRRFLRLPHPRTGHAALFFPCCLSNGESSVLEVHAVEPINPRSWFNGGEVISDGKLLVMTPLDPVFLLVPLMKTTISSDGSAGNFRTPDDLLDAITTKLGENDDPLLIASQQDLAFAFDFPCIKQVMSTICDSKEIASDLIVYRYSYEKLLAYLCKKATRLSQYGDIDKSRTMERQLAKDGLLEDGKEELLRAGRLKLACDLISQYVDADVMKDLESKFDFAALDADIAALDAAASAHETTVEQKKGKAKEKSKESDKDVKKRKAGAQGSTGVDKLKKANIKGMSKLSSFFGKKAES